MKKHFLVKVGKETGKNIIRNVKCSIDHNDITDFGFNPEKYIDISQNEYIHEVTEV